MIFWCWCAFCDHWGQRRTIPFDAHHRLSAGIQLDLSSCAPLVMHAYRELRERVDRAGSLGTMPCRMARAAGAQEPAEGSRRAKSVLHTVVAPGGCKPLTEGDPPSCSHQQPQARSCTESERPEHTPWGLGGGLPRVEEYMGERVGDRPRESCSSTPTPGE